MTIRPSGIGPVKILAAALAGALMMASANAQSAGGGHRGHQAKADKSTAQKPKVDEKAYADALKVLPDKQFDPWHGVR